MALGMATCAPGGGPWPSPSGPPFPPGGSSPALGAGDGGQSLPHERRHMHTQVPVSPSKPPSHHEQFMPVFPKPQITRNTYLRGKKVISAIQRKS